MDISSFKPLGPVVAESLLNKRGRYDAVNRLCVIGNGFDLAHGLRTGFNHFLGDYCKKVLTHFDQHLSYKDRLLQFNFKGGFGQFRDKLPEQLTFSDSPMYLSNLLKNEKISISYRSELLADILRGFTTKKWVDFEVLYFDRLKDISKNNKNERLTRFNEDFEFLKNQLLSYLKEVENHSQIVSCEDLLDQFQSPIKKQETLINTVKSDLNPSEILLLNFNYTKTLEPYIEELRKKHSTAVNQIHGELDGPENNSAIFGFGDELDSDYKEFEHHRDDILFAHIKSFKYLRNNNYRHLMEFINAKPFQVHVYGHSCGISDRTMLNSIFEHDNCISIKLFYHQTEKGNDFIEKTYSISRHFKDKQMLRNKVVSFENSEAMAQPKTIVDENC